MTFTALGGPHVADLCSPPLEVVQDSRLERVTQVGASAGIEGRNKPGVGRVAFFSRVAAALTFGVSGNRHGARQERVREMAPRIGSLKMLPAASSVMLPETSSRSLLAGLQPAKEERQPAAKGGRFRPSRVHHIHAHGHLRR